MKTGFAGYVLPAFENYVYVAIDNGDMFGHVDFALHKRFIEIELMKL